jgi:hypothetical protein
MNKLSLIFAGVVISCNTLIAQDILRDFDELPQSDASKMVVKYVDTFDNVNHPQILYWFWDEKTITDKQYLKDIDKMASQSPFDLIFITSRFTQPTQIDAHRLQDEEGFGNTGKMKPYLEEAVRYAHSKGFKIGIHLTKLFFVKTPSLMNKKDATALIAEGECTLDAQGEGSVKNQSFTARINHPVSAELVNVWLFKKVSDGFYDPSSLIEAKTEWVQTQINDDFSVDVSITAPIAYSGYHAYIVTKHYHDSHDVLSPEPSDYFKKLLDAYSDIPFDGTALDEFGNMMININKSSMNPERAWCDRFEDVYRNTYHTNPVRLLLDMRYAPENKPEIRIKAVNTYFDTWTKGPVQVENFFYKYSKQLYGDACFSGFHTTFHNALTGDDVWYTGVNWWDLPREYGQTDEGMPMPDRMGIGISGSQPVMYNMFYNKNKEAIFRDALNNASFGVRVHYHAWNDNHGWGKDLQDDDFLEDVTPVEQSVRLLNHFDPAPSKLPLLIVYNFPYLFNWYPDSDQQNKAGIRGSDMQSVASSVWKAGYPCATIPSTWLERGTVKIRKDGKIQIKDRLFDAVIFLYPQYAKQASFSFMKELLDKKGALMVKGEATKDFDGNDCSGLFAEISGRALSFDIEQISKLGVLLNSIPNGTFLQDGSVVMSDYTSVKDKTNTEFSIRIGKDVFSGSYQGVFALKTDSKGRIEKLACGNFRSLQRNGVTILKTETPTDIFLTKIKGKTVISLKGANNKVELIK